MADMEPIQVRGNTWVLKSWEHIPLYRIDDTRCILLDTGLVSQRQALENALESLGLRCVGVIGSHSHIDHMGSNAYLQRKYGAQIALSLGEAGVLASYLGVNSQCYNMSPTDILNNPSMDNVACLADRIILPQETRIEMCGVPFDIIHTPGHSIDHICVRTPDNVLYLGDAMMTGRTLHRSKFPYALCLQDYMRSMEKLREEPADWYIVAHEGIYREILPLIDMELRFLTERMIDLLEMAGESVIPRELSALICREYGIGPKDLIDLAYFERSAQAYISYLQDRGYLEAVMDEYRILYRRTALGNAILSRRAGAASMPETGRFR